MDSRRNGARWCRRGAWLGAATVVTACATEVQRAPEATASASAALASGWVLEQVDAAGVTGQYSSLAFDRAGHPFISYFDATGWTLRLASRTGPSWQTEIVDTGGGKWSSLALDSQGVPWVSYYDGSGGQLKIAHKTAAGWTVWVVDGASTGYYTSLAIDRDDRPAVSHYDDANQALDLTRFTGSAWSKATIPVGGPGGRFTSLAFDGQNRPRISFQALGAITAKYAYQDDAGWHVEEVDPAPNRGFYSSLALLPDGTPEVAYQDIYYGDLWYARRGAAGWTPEHVSGAMFDHAGEYTRMALDRQGTPFIAHRWMNLPYDGHTELRLERRAASGWTTTTVAAGFDVGDLDLAFDPAGRAAISFHDKTGGDLWFARDCSGGACDEQLAAGDCHDGFDNDLDGLIDCDEPGCLCELGALCRNGVDDDQNGVLDCFEPGCAGDPWCSLCKDSDGGNHPEVPGVTIGWYRDVHDVNILWPTSGGPGIWPDITYFECIREQGCAVDRADPPTVARPGLGDTKCNPRCLYTSCNPLNNPNCKLVSCSKLKGCACEGHIGGACADWEEWGCAYDWGDVFTYKPVLGAKGAPMLDGAGKVITAPVCTHGIAPSDAQPAKGGSCSYMGLSPLQKQLLLSNPP